MTQYLKSVITLEEIPVSVSSSTNPPILQKRTEDVPLTAGLDVFVRRQLKRRPLLFLFVAHTLPALYIVAWGAIPLNAFTGDSTISFWWFSYVYIMISQVNSVFLFLGAIQVLDCRCPRSITEVLQYSAIMAMPIFISTILHIIPGGLEISTSGMWWTGSIFFAAVFSMCWAFWLRWTEIQDRAVEKFAFRDLFAPFPVDVSFGIKELGSTSFSHDETKRLSDMGQLRDQFWWCVCTMISIGAYVAGQVYSEIYVSSAAQDMLVEVTSISLFHIIVRTVTWSAGALSLAKTGRRDLPHLTLMYGQLTIYIFYRNIYSSGLKNEYSVYVLAVGKVIIDVLWLLISFSDKYRTFSCGARIKRIAELTRPSEVCGDVESPPKKASVGRRMPTVQDIFECHDRDVICDQMLKFVAQYSSIVAFCLWFPLLRLGYNSFAYPYFQTLSDAELPGLVHDMSIIFIGEVIAGAIIYSIIRWKKKKDMVSFYVRLLITQPSFLYMVFVMQVNITSDLLFGLLAFDKFV